ncbi:hypothetical protein VTK73DRAFT_6449 [Phialemonium thermophilum]|uniref:Uncharacterized protein n=1 Tax=Phialemonium thermophilum TaxID=223376 RepID=A0ABR3V194_9PEZI
MELCSAVALQPHPGHRQDVGAHVPAAARQHPAPHPLLYLRAQRLQHRPRRRHLHHRHLPVPPHRLLLEAGQPAAQRAGHLHQHGRLLRCHGGPDHLDRRARPGAAHVDLCRPEDAGQG